MAAVRFGFPEGLLVGVVPRFDDDALQRLADGPLDNAAQAAFGRGGQAVSRLVYDPTAARTANSLQNLRRHELCFEVMLNAPRFGPS